MRNIFTLVLALSLITIAGCSSSKYNLASLAGTNMRDLESAKDQGAARTFDMSQNNAFEETLTVLNNNKLTVFQADPTKGYIVAMGINEQVNTTRIGIFFESVSTTKTKITLSSLSSLALAKAKKIIFGGLSSSNR